MMLKLVICTLLLIPSVVYAQEEWGKDDPRLDRKVTVEAKGQSISDLLSDLSDKSGVTLDCGANKNDWEG